MHLIHVLGEDYLDEVGCWLRKHGFYKYYDLFMQKGIFMLKEIPQNLKRADLKKVSNLKLLIHL